ncbi:CHAT domain-containing protein [Planktothrix pseudagardhii]|uniref:Tetratricopeptide repeat protein 28 n=1 Tax=Planktothrix pseudagardhii TaxID=132604 RepID=A0A9W4CGI3_9CYAN|nr:CHAT domain-containing protein [Planktothrix pseudagardhii]CAD5929404.1 Tetratricopeptide repeat protein 28 [Planktothrix pseudagardhii]
MNKQNTFLGTVLLTIILFLFPGVLAIATPKPIFNQGKRPISNIAQQPATTEQQTAKELAEKAFAEALQLQNQETVESLKQAIAKYQEAIQLFRAADDQHGEAKTLGSMGIAYSQLGEQQQAINYLNQSLKLSEAEKNIPNQITSLVRIGLAYQELNQLQQSISYYEQALPLLRTTGEKAQEALILAKIALVYQSLSNFEQAIAYFNQSITLYEAEKDSANAANTLKGLGLIYTLSGNNQSAITQYEKALLYWQAINSNSEAARVLTLMGNTASNLGNYQQAINYYNQAISIWQDLGEKDQIAQSFQLLGQLYRELGDIDTSLSYQKQALSLWEALNDSAGQAQMLSEIGLTYRTILDDTKQAISYYEQARSLWRSLNNQSEEAQILNAISSIYYWSKNYQQAREYLNQSLQIFQAQKLPSWEAETLVKLAMVYSLSGDKDQALIYLNQAISIIETLPHPDFKALEFSRAANTYYLLKDYEKGLKYHNQSLQLWQGMGNLSNQAFELAIIARIERDRGNFNQSLTNIEAAIKIIEDLRTKIGSQELRQSYFATVQDYYQFYIDLLMQLHQQNPQKGYDALAFHASERSRARSLVELLTEAGANIRQGVDPKLLEQEQNLQQQLNTVENQRYQLTQGNYTQQQLDEIKQQSQSLLNQLDELEAKIRLTSPRYANLKYPQPLTLQQIQEKVLDDDTLLLEYSLGEERSYLWAVTKNSITSYVLPKQSEIEEIAQPWREMNESTSVESGLPLSEILLKPVASQLGNKRLLIVGDGVLQYIPFAALPIPSQPNTPLLVEHEIVTAPSTSTIAIQREQLQNRPTVAKTVAVLADPVFSLNDSRVTRNAPQQNPQTLNNLALTRAARNLGIGEGAKTYSRLEYTRTEAEEIIALVPENQRLQALDFQASLEQAKNPHLSEYQIVHFATHGLLDSVNPELSGVVLSLFNQQGQAEDGFLRLQDIFNLNLPAELVVLSACQTGLGKETKGEGLVGITRGFMYAGARRVVVSLWSVNDASTSELMSRFYQPILKEGKNPIIALREAQLEMWKSGKWQSPYYWAAFTVQGDWR